MGGTSTCNVWFEYGLTDDNLNMETSEQLITSVGLFNSTIGSLSQNTTYYYRAGANNGYCTDYGSIKSFKTLD
jgi:hypothetical protein